MPAHREIDFADDAAIADRRHVHFRSKEDFLDRVTLVDHPALVGGGTGRASTQSQIHRYCSLKALQRVLCKAFSAV